jgi:hypothetical protein
MVRVLVGDQHRVQVGQPVPAVGEVSRVDQDPGAVGLDEDGRVPEVGDAHGATLSSRS